jgi:hypothetical protein
MVNNMKVSYFDLRYQKSTFFTTSFNLNFTACDPSTMNDGAITLLDNTYELTYWQGSGVQEYHYKVTLECPIDWNRTLVIFTTEAGW